MLRCMMKRTHVSPLPTAARKMKGARRDSTDPILGRRRRSQRLREVAVTVISGRRGSLPDCQIEICCHQLSWKERHHIDSSRDGIAQDERRRYLWEGHYGACVWEFGQCWQVGRAKHRPHPGSTKKETR
jgi:hypothetical protein